MWPFSDNSWKDVVAEKQAERAKRIEQHASKDLSASSSNSEEILGSTACQIVEAIKTGKWTAKEVVQAFIARAIVAHKETNCLTEILFDDALQEAENLDNEYARTKVLRGPLHGVPVSVKDQYNVKGYDSSVGFTRWSKNPATTDSEVVAQVKAAGGIIIAKTNVPQTMLSFECSNPLWGRTTNPYSKNHTCGGSSGGEAAVLAMDGAALGFGSDVGGSLRIPAHYCGVYSLKPGGGRVSNGGMASPVPGFRALNSVSGPMCRSVEDIKLACKLIFAAGGSNNAKGYPPVPYREHQLPQKLKFGYYTQDACFKTSPACARAVTETVEALRKAGHVCVEFQPPDVAKAFATFVSLTSADGYETLLSHLGPDPKENALFLITLGPRLPSFIRWAAGKIIMSAKNDEVFNTGLLNSKVRNVQEHWATVKDKEDYIEMWYREVWDKYDFDGILAPVQASPALPHGSVATLAPVALATFLYNVLDAPVGHVPVTRVNPTTDGYKPMPEVQGSTVIEEEMFTKSKKAYDVDLMKGLPVGVQVVGKAWEEEKVIEMMAVVDKALGSRDFGPGGWKKFTSSK